MPLGSRGGGCGCSSRMGYFDQHSDLSIILNFFPTSLMVPARYMSYVWGRTGIYCTRKGTPAGIVSHQKMLDFPSAVSRVKTHKTRPTPHMPLWKTARIVTFSHRRSKDLNKGMHVKSRTGILLTWVTPHLHLTPRRRVPLCLPGY